MMRLEDAQKVADKLVDRLSPCVQRVEVAGSVRREKKEVKDIELVVVPKMGYDLFGNPTGEPFLDHMIEALSRCGRVVRRGTRYRAYQDILGNKGLNLDLFVVFPPAQWGTIMSIRTGPANYIRHIMKRLKERGTPCRGGFVRDKEGCIIKTPTEESFFTLAGVKHVEPRKRMSDHMHLSDGRRIYIPEWNTEHGPWERTWDPYGAGKVGELMT